MSDENSYTMRQAGDMIEDAIQYPLGMGQNRVIYLEGDPGLGKTAMMHVKYMKFRRYKNDQIKQAVYWRHDDGSITTTKPNDKAWKEVDNIHLIGGFTHFIAYVAPEREPVDWGLPMPNEKRDAITMLPLDEFKFKPEDRPFIVFDEVDKAPNMMQNVIARIMHELKIGNIVFPVGTFIVAAGNKLTNRAGGFAANTHIKNRRTHVPVRVNALEWIEDVGIPFDLHSSIVSYIRTDHTALHLFDSGSPAFPSPRSVTKVGLMLNQQKAPHVEKAFIEGDCGVDWANSFWGHLKIFRELRDPEVVIADPEKVPIPSGKNSVAIMYAEVTALARYANAKNSDAIFRYMNRIDAEFAFCGYRDVMQRDVTLVQRSKAAQKWAVEHSTMLKATKA